MTPTRAQLRLRLPHRRHGVTTIELLVAITVTLIIVAIVAPLYRAQTNSVTRTAGRTDAARSATFAVDAIEQDMRNAGVGVFDGQPLLVRGSVDAVSFNANMVTARTNDLVAVFYDPDADEAALGALQPATSVTLPNSSIVYPTVAYNSNAETISYYTRPDTGVAPIAGASRVVLYRMVNRQPEEVIARNLLLVSSVPMFRYYRRSLSGVLTEITGSAMPLYHATARHASATDTGATATIDSVAVVKLSVISMYRDPRGRAIVDTVQRNIRIANQGLLQRAQCGEVPLTPGAPSVFVITLAGLPAVRLAWAASTDELLGERDVEMYAVYRRVGGSVDWGEPLANVPGAGLTMLQYIDNTVATGVQYDFAISALDCTPAPSALTAASTILVP